MTTRFLGSIVGVILFGSFPSVHADYSVNFTAPPYTLGQTVIGVDGWEQRTLDGPETDASLETAPWDSSSTALKLYSTSTGNTSARRTRIGNRFSDVVEGVSTARITMNLAFEWTNSASNTSTVAFFNDGDSSTPSETNTPFTLGFAVNNTTGGLYLVDGNGTHNILSIANMKQGALYSFVFELNFSTNTFAIAATGVDINDDPFSFAQSNLAFRSDIDKIGSVYLFNNRGDIMTLYSESLAVQGIPEPGTAALAAGACVVISLSMLRRRRTRS